MTREESEDLLIDANGAEASVIPDEFNADYLKVYYAVTSELRGKWQEKRRSSISKDMNVVRWEQLKQLLQSGKHKVSKHINHLLKAPFCVHPKTGRVRIPIDPGSCEDFDPTAVPTLSTLLEELNRGSLRGDVTDELDRTSLGKSIKYFRSSFLQHLPRSCKEEMECSYNTSVQKLKSPLSW